MMNSLLKLMVATCLLPIFAGIAWADDEPDCVYPQWNWGNTGGVYHYYSEYVLFNTSNEQDCGQSYWDNWNGPIGMDNPSVGCVQGQADCDGGIEITQLMPDPSEKRPESSELYVALFQADDDENGASKPKPGDQKLLDEGYLSLQVGTPLRHDQVRLFLNEQNAAAKIKVTVKERPIVRVTEENGSTSDFKVFVVELDGSSSFRPGSNNTRGDAGVATVGVGLQIEPVDLDRVTRFIPTDKRQKITDKAWRLDPDGVNYVVHLVK